MRPRPAASSRSSSSTSRRIEGIVDGADPDQVRIGQVVRLTSAADVPRYRIADISTGGAS
jgi:hypothetical protein